MRSANLGAIEEVSKFMPKGKTLRMFSRICICRSFEKNVADAHNKGLIKNIPIYLSLGQESITAALSIVFPRAKKFGQHRGHDIYICWDGDLAALRDELLCLPTGCAKGMGGSASIHSPEIGMFGHDGLMGTQVPIAVGYALGSKNTTLAIIGDASAEEGYVLGAMGEAASKKAPVLFVCYDNNLSILTEVSVRRSWSIVDEARAKGMPTVDISDNPWLVAYHASKFANQLPALINVRTCRELWHAGSGCDGPPEWNRYELIKKEMTALGFESQARNLEEDLKKYVDSFWKKAV